MMVDYQNMAQQGLQELRDQINTKTQLKKVKVQTTQR